MPAARGLRRGSCGFAVLAPARSRAPRCRKPLPEIRSSILRLRWQPPAMRATADRAGPASARRPAPARGRARRTAARRRASARGASRRARGGASGMVHSVQVVTTVSMLRSSSGTASAEASSSSTGTGAPAARSRAMRSSSGDGSSPMTGTDGRPVERQVQPRSDADFQHAPFGRADHALAERNQLPLGASPDAAGMAAHGADRSSFARFPLPRRLRRRRDRRRPSPRCDVNSSGSAMPSGAPGP